MTFSVIVPNAGQSPGLFPSQNNTNFQRLQDIINNDHNFTNSTSAAQGIHKQVTLINRATPMGLLAGNGILYSQADTFGASQVFWYNGSTNVQVSNTSTFTVIGTALIAASGVQTIFSNPGYSYQGTAFILDSSTNAWYNKTIFLKPGVTSSVIAINQSIGTAVKATLAYDGNDLKLTSTAGSSITFSWSLVLSRVP